MASEGYRPSQGQIGLAAVRTEGNHNTHLILCAAPSMANLLPPQAKDEAFLEQRVKKLTNHQVGFDEATPAPPRTFVPTTYKGQRLFALRLIE